MKTRIAKCVFGLGLAWAALAVNLPRAAAETVCPLDLRKPVQVKSLETLKRVPILNQGRIKPFETYARNFLLQLSGRQHYKKEDAVTWMARFLFAPRTTFNDEIFLINNPEIPEALQITPRKNRRYTFRELDPGYDKLKELAGVIDGIEERNRSLVDKEILRVYDNLLLYVRLSGAFLYAVPHPDFTFSSPETARQLKLPEGQTPYSFFDILEASDALSRKTLELEKKPHGEWDETEREIAGLLRTLSFWTEYYANCPLGMIPTQSRDNEEWMSPMDTILAGGFDPVDQEEVRHLRNMAAAYWNGVQLEFDTSARAFLNAEAGLLSAKEQKAVRKIPLELLYNQLDLFLWAKMFYGLGVIFFLLSLLSEKKWMYPAAVTVTVLGFLPHVTALVLRVMIMSRPPVSNLFETFVFVGAVCVALGLLMEWANRNWVGLVAANICGLVLGLIAGKFSADGDTMQMLVAVLNSNFWLSTHVLAITAGYAGCCVAGIMGHIYILQALAQPKNTARLELTYKNMMGVLGFGLTLSFLGTALGGIWADQSWGRFWGWDPKENGALMIVLWCAVIFHARIAKLIQPLGAAVGCVLTLIVVMWAWFGVNLLSVGLHSYGFTSGVAGSLAAYVVFEILFIAVSVMWLGKKKIPF